MSSSAPTTALTTRRRRSLLAAAVCAVLAVLAAYVATASSFQLFIVNSVLLAVIGAASLNLLQGTVGQISIGNAAFLAVGAFAAVAADRAGVRFPYDLPVAIGAGALAGAVVGLPAMRIRGFYLCFATLAAHFIFIQLAQSYQSKVVGAAGFLLPLQFAGQSLEGQQRSWTVLLVVVVAVVLTLVCYLTTGRLGRAWRVIRDHEVIAGSLGIRAARYKLAAFVVSSSLIALQGALAAHLAGYVAADTFTLALAISYLAMVLVGGEDSLLGSVVGAVIIVSLPFVTADAMQSLALPGQFSAQIAQAVYGGLIILFVLYTSGGVSSWLRRATAALTGRRRVQQSAAT